jgi:hypothetical protein
VKIAGYRLLTIGGLRTKDPALLSKPGFFMVA